MSRPLAADFTISRAELSPRPLGGESPGMQFTIAITCFPGLSEFPRGQVPFACKCFLVGHPVGRGLIFTSQIGFLRLARNLWGRRLNKWPAATTTSVLGGTMDRTGTSAQRRKMRMLSKSLGRPAATIKAKLISHSEKNICLSFWTQLVPQSLEITVYHMS